jgi:hypothetical protein
MSQRMSLLGAAAITTFVLVLVGALLARVGASTPDTQLAMPPGEVASTFPAPTASADLAAREAAYQEQIRLANERIAQANALLATTHAPPQAGTPDLAVPATSAPAFALSSADAEAIAREVAPDARLLRAPELVRYDGRPAYELVFNLGSVYIDATSGALLASDITQASLAQDGEDAWTEASEHHGEHEEDEHEEEEDNHD